MLNQLILLTRSWQVYVFLTIIFIIFLVSVRKYRGSVIAGLMVFILLVGFVSWYDCFSWHPIEPITLVFQTTINEWVSTPYAKQRIISDDRSWSPIDPINEANLLNREIMKKYIASGGVFDFEQYTYLISIGCTIDALYRHSHASVHGCIAVHSYYCLGNEVFIYCVPFVKNIHPC